MNIDYTYSSPNYSVGRNGHSPSVIVNHITAGLMPGCLTWLCNPDSQASSHYLIAKTGIVYQLVCDNNTAWTCGDVQKPTWPLLEPGMNPNTISLNIEHEALSPWEALTEPQYEASLALHRMLCAKHFIPQDALHIIGHSALNSQSRANDPGPLFPWERLIRDLNQSVLIRVNGTTADTDARLEQGRTWVPIRFIEQLGYSVQWNSPNIIDIRPTRTKA